MVPECAFEMMQHPHCFIYIFDIELPFIYVFACYSGYLGVQGTEFIDCGVLRVLSEHLETFDAMKVFIAVDDPLVAEALKNSRRPRAQETAFAHLF